MSLDKRYQVLNLCYTFQKMQQHLHPVVLFGNRDVILVDCGYDSLQHLSGYRFLKGLTAILN